MTVPSPLLSSAQSLRAHPLFMPFTNILANGAWRVAIVPPEQLRFCVRRPSPSLYTARARSIALPGLAHSRNLIIIVKEKKNFCERNLCENRNGREYLFCSWDSIQNNSLPSNLEQISFQLLVSCTCSNGFIFCPLTFVLNQMNSFNLPCPFVKPEFTIFGNYNSK